MDHSNHADQTIDDHVGSGCRSFVTAISASEMLAWRIGQCDEEAAKARGASSQQSSSPIHRVDMVLPKRQYMYSSSWLGYLLVLIASLWAVPASAAFIEFDNCLSDSYLNSNPPELQFVPKYVDAVFATETKSHNLLVTVYGNVTGSGPEIQKPLLPPPNSSYWLGNSTDQGGKIIDIPDDGSSDPKITTLFNKLNFLSYQPYDNDDSFCANLLNASCPLGPSFNVTDPYSLPSFNLSYDLYSSYAFTSLTATLLVKYGDEAATSISCVSANITPDLGSTLSGLLTYIPVMVLVFVAFSTAFAGIWSPWGSSDTFRWTTNYGRDEDLLRLVTPGFGDCLQYIQFIALTGGLSLNYPGFYQPITSKVAWSALMFNQSFVRSGNGNETTQQPLVDGIYVLTGDYGLNRTRQLVGMDNVTDVWAGMTVWLLVIVAAALAFIQAGFLFRWIYRQVNKTPEEDLRAKNFPFSVGNVIRIVFNYFLLPIVALSMFQLAVTPSGQSPAYFTALAVVTLALILIFGLWLLLFIAKAKPKSYLYDDLPTLLMYGALYNTYSDNAAGFALAPLIITFVRGTAIGAVQGSGIAQIVLLAICEVIFILTLHAFRPFHGPTSMNAYHTIFSAVRLTTVFLMISFAPSLGVTDGPKGWIGYAILLLHAIVLGVGFWINALQTIVEVVARLAGAGGEARGGLVKVFGHRQLSRRLPRGAGATSRQSQISSAAMLNADDERKTYMTDGSGRLRSQSAGSTGILLNRHSTGFDSVGIDAYGAIPPQQLNSAGSSYTPTTPGEASTFSYLPSAAAPSGLGRDRGPIGGIAAAEAAPFYYRPPRPRRPTLEENSSPAERSRGSWASGDWANKRWSEQSPETPEQGDEGPSISRRGTPILQQQPIDGTAEPRRSQADYTTREVDFYYGVRGPALNANVPSRRIRTGPADPTGPAASAVGWFKGLFGGKTKEKGKGFEVVRSSRMPPGMKRPGGETPPEGVPVATGGVRNGPIDSDDESVHGRSTSAAAHADTGAEAESTHEDHLVSPLQSEDETSEGEDGSFEIHRISDVPPTIPGLELPDEGIELPSRFPSKATSKASSKRSKMIDLPVVPGLPTRMPSRKPSVPRKSSRRKSQSVDLSQPGSQFLRQHQPQSSLDSSRLPFERSTSHNRNSTISTNSSMITPETAGHSRTPSTALGNLGADFRDDRPTSVGYVHHHSIQTVNPLENTDLLGASAEIISGSRSSGGSGGSSMDDQRV